MASLVYRKAPLWQDLHCHCPTCSCRSKGECFWFWGAGLAVTVERDYVEQRSCPLGDDASSLRVAAANINRSVVPHISSSKVVNNKCSGSQCKNELTCGARIIVIHSPEEENKNETWTCSARAFFGLIHIRIHQLTSTFRSGIWVDEYTRLDSRSILVTFYVCKYPQSVAVQGLTFNRLWCGSKKRMRMVYVHSWDTISYCRK